ncbi:hypothetical protein OOM_0453 [Francisella orientalis str. Toba 04]|nr:hypothetical protein OOM_0453 [Francisella orientalis str. Toba 04]
MSFTKIRTTSNRIWISIKYAYNVRPSHYALSLLAAVLTSFISLRQIALHVSDPVGFGSTVFGLPMYNGYL